MQTTKQRFDELTVDESLTPLEALEFFCSLAMNGQDWLDVEPLFAEVGKSLTLPLGSV
jgi:hypothetical protein